MAAGETLTSIAKKYRVTPKAIADANNLEHAVALNTGEKLIIPAIQPAAENKRRMVSYRVRKGDTFLGIADRFSVEPEDLRKWNRLAANKVRRGMVLRVLESGKVLIEGVNRVKKHQRPNPVKGQTGGIIDKEMPLHLSNVMLVNPATGKGDRVGIKFLEAQGGAAPRKVRFFKSNGEVVDV